MESRPIVQAFAEAMEERLRANDHKCGGENEPVLGYLYPRLVEEAGELARQLITHSWPQRDKRAILRECTDIANFAMMVADVCGALTQG